MEKKDWTGARADASKAIELGIRTPEMYFLRSLAERGLKDLEAAIRSVEKALEVAPRGWTQRAEMEKILEELREERKGK